MTADLLIGIDLGAGALKTSIIRLDGTLAGEASAPAASPVVPAKPVESPAPAPVAAPAPSIAVIPMGAPEVLDPSSLSRGPDLEFGIRRGDRFEIRRVSRADEGSPATGSHAIHAQEQDMLLSAAFAPLGEKQHGDFH